MKRIKEFFLLKDDAFFDMLHSLASCANGCAIEFERFVREYGELDAGQRGMRLKALNGYEKDGDVLVRTISEELYRNFITPIDREDIHELASNLDTSIDLMEDIGKKFLFYRMDGASPIMKSQAKIAMEQMSEILAAIGKLKGSKPVKDEYVRVFELEDLADTFYEQAMTELFEPSNELLPSNPMNVIKYKDIYDELETLTDRNQRLAVIIEGIVIKHV